MFIRVMPFAFLAPAVLVSQTITVSPQRIMADEPALIRVSGLRPAEPVVIRAELTDGGGNLWTSRAEFIADGQGRIDLSRQGPVSGSYQSVSSHGLIWSMKPVEESTGFYRFPSDLADQPVKLILDRDGKNVSECVLTVVRLARGVRRIAVRESHIRGVLFVPPGEARHPGVVVLGGSGGGALELDAAWLASRGFVALALGYFNYEDLPRNLEAIPLEYFQQALEWLAIRPEVKPGGLGVFGRSRGGELVLQLGSMFSMVRCVVAYVPNNRRGRAFGRGTKVEYAWTWKGEALPYIKTPGVLDSESSKLAEIEVERTNGPILLLSGEEDKVWSSSLMSEAVMARLRARNFGHRFEHLQYAGAGHGVGLPQLFPRWRGEVKHPVSGMVNAFGGGVAADALSTVDSMPKVLRWLRDSLP
jgi:dienelactone hydrolase